MTTRKSGARGPGVGSCIAARPAGAMERRAQLDEAARVGARVDVRLRLEYVPRLAVAELARRLRLYEVVDAGAAAAQLLLGGLGEVEAGDRPEHRARSLADPLGRGKGG